jgi:histidine triad (HIT) family protein
MDSTCIFCAILDGGADGSFVARRSHVVAFLDILPIGEGHTLIVPRRHVVGLADLDDTEGAQMFQLARDQALNAAAF